MFNINSDKREFQNLKMDKHNIGILYFGKEQSTKKM